MGNAVEFARSGVAKLARDHKQKYKKRDEPSPFQELGPRRLPIVGIEIMYLIFKASNPFGFDEGLYIKTNKTTKYIQGQPGLEERIIQASLVPLRNPESPDPLTAVYDPKASEKFKKATYKVGGPEETPPQTP